MSTDLSIPLDPRVCNETGPAETPPAASRKKSTVKRAALPAAAEFDASFAALDAQSVDAPAWPIHPVSWFQPERAPALPSWNGLAIERTQRIPVPGFVPPEATLLNRSAALAQPALRVPTIRVTLPRSGLAPLAWDARALLREETGK